MLEYVIFWLFISYQAHACQDFELLHELCNEKRFAKHPAGGLRELRHGLGDGLINAKFDEHDWEIAHRVLVPVFGPLAISEMHLAISNLPESHGPSHDVRDILVLKGKTEALSNGSIDTHIELQLPAGMTYRAGEYLAVLPKNPLQNIERVVHHFNLPWDGSLYIKSKDTFLTHGTSLRIREMLGSYVELSQTATRRNIKVLLHHTNDPATKMSLTSIGGNYFPSYITARKTSILALLETYPAIDLPFGTYLAMLPSLRPRGSRAVADGVEGIMKRLRMEWQGGCCAVEEAEKWLEESRGRNCMANDFD